MNESFKPIGKDIGRLAFIGVAQVADFGTTLFALQNGLHEANPIIREILNSNGDTGFALYKLSGILFLTGLYLISKRYDKDFETRKIGTKNTLFAGSLLMLAVSVGNVASDVGSNVFS